MDPIRAPVQPDRVVRDRRRAEDGSLPISPLAVVRDVDGVWIAEQEWAIAVVGGRFIHVGHILFGVHQVPTVLRRHRLRAGVRGIRHPRCSGGSVLGRNHHDAVRAA